MSKAGRLLTPLRVILTIVAVVAGGLALFVARYYPVSNRTVVFGELTVPEGRFVVAGESEGPLNGWYMTLYWKRPDKPWVLYYLDHDSEYWSDVKLTAVDRRVVISSSGKLRADVRIAPDLLAISRPGRKGENSNPKGVIVGGEPFGNDRFSVISPSSSKWDPSWVRLNEN